MFTKSTSNEIIDNVTRVGVLQLSQISIFILISIISCKVQAYRNAKSIRGFGLNFLNLTPLIQNPGSATVVKEHLTEERNRRSNYTGYNCYPVNILIIFIVLCDRQVSRSCSQSNRALGFLNHLSGTLQERCE